MDYLTFINQIIVIVGVPTIIGACIYIGRKLQILDTLDNTLRTEITPDIKNVRERLITVETRIDVLWKDKYAPASSPRQLNEKGQEILDKSGIKTIIDEKREKLTEIVKALNPKNAYDAENAILITVADLPKHCPDILDRLKDGAFKTGADIDTLSLVGSIYLRNLIFKELGFEIEDIDKPSK